MQEIKQDRKIGQDFDLWGLIAFTTPSILMQVFTQLFQTLDDGLFVSRYVGQYALAAINLLSPLNFVRMAMTQLFGMGASTIAAQRMGEQHYEGAKRVFTRITISAAAVSSLFAIACVVYSKPLCLALGADEHTLEYALAYTRIVYACTPLHVLSVVLTSFYATAGKPKMGLFTSLLNGCINLILDVILIPIMELGVVGSSLSTVIGDAAVTLTGLIFFSMKKQEIHFVRPRKKIISTTILSCKYAFSQFINSISLGVYNLLTNQVILSLCGPDGIAANAIVSDLRRILNSAIAGYASCVAPVIAYNIGSKNHHRLKKVINYNFTYWFFASITVVTLGEILRTPLLQIFFKEDASEAVRTLAYEGLTIEFLGIFLVTGSIVLNRMFVAMNEVKYASVASFMRNIVFRTIFTVILPFFFGMTGLWWSFTVSEVLSFALSASLFMRAIKKYNIYPKDLHFSIHEE